MSVKWRHIVSIVQCGYRLQYTALLDFKAMYQIGILKIIQMRVRMLVRCTMYILASAYVYVYIYSLLAKPKAIYFLDSIGIITNDRKERCIHVL